MVDKLLKKYSLDEIPHWKKSKQNCNGSKRYKNHANIYTLPHNLIYRRLCAIISKVLKNRSVQHKKIYVISMALAGSLLKHREKGTKGAHRALFQWLNNN